MMRSIRHFLDNALARVQALARPAVTVPWVVHVDDEGRICAYDDDKRDGSMVPLSEEQLQMIRTGQARPMILGGIDFGLCVGDKRGPDAPAKTSEGEQWNSNNTGTTSATHAIATS